MQTVETSATVDQELLRMLDRGIDDVRAGRTLPHDAAMREVRRIRNERREVEHEELLFEGGFDHLEG